MIFLPTTLRANLPGVGSASQVNQSENAAKAISRFKNDTKVEVLQSNPFRSFASRCELPQAPTKLSKVYNLTKM